MNSDTINTLETSFTYLYNFQTLSSKYSHSENTCYQQSKKLHIHIHINNAKQIYVHRGYLKSKKTFNKSKCYLPGCIE